MVSNNYMLKQHPHEKWLSKEYKAVETGFSLFELFTIITEMNDLANEVGYIENKVKGNTFLPFVRKGFAESIAWDFSLTAVKKFR